jgi:hypothetical protein
LEPADTISLSPKEDASESIISVLDSTQTTANPSPFKTGSARRRDDRPASRCKSDRLISTVGVRGTGLDFAASKPAAASSPFTAATASDAGVEAVAGISRRDSCGCRPLSISFPGDGLGSIVFSSDIPRPAVLSAGPHPRIIIEMISCRGSIRPPHHSMNI